MDVQFTKDNIAVLTMNNGQNRIDYSFVERFNQMLDQVERNSDCIALVTTGRGKFFSNGLDLEWAISAYENFNSFVSLLKRIITLPLPTIAAINGHAFAGGAFIALCHDLRVMQSDKGWMSWNEIHIKATFTEPLYKLLQVKIAPGPVQTQAILFGKRFTAQEAMSAQLVDDVTTMTNLMDDSLRLARKTAGIGGFDRFTLSALKNDIYKDFTTCVLGKIRSML
ncbi:enoyl-CoA delta isomerase 2, peroxisomal-like [Gigantopelta aegis]|uniref:enoyl-CoA delta isomerase 2, peroxisomal-like n=1 Tax=Gigantopelta aegis TaxID=1735272 RepID=UPI001B88DB9E|nr:enoyl-CoA delta isomerase 2, peroxisomal-like [Gigantopelta aegis]